MSYYTEKNGLANFWNHDNTRLELAKWVYYHPEDFEELLNLILTNTGANLEPMSDEDIDNITGVDQDG